MLDENDSIVLLVEDIKTLDTLQKCVITRVEEKSISRYYLFSNISDFNGVRASTFPSGYNFSWVIGNSKRYYNFDEIIEALNKEDNLSEILDKILDTGGTANRGENWIIKDWWIAGPSETKKEKQNKETKMTEPKKMFGGMNISDLLKFKMLSGMLKDGNDISFEKVAMFNCLSGGSFEISEVLKAKLMSSLVKDDKAIENLPVEKLMIIQMLEKGEFDAQKLLEFKLAEKLFAE